MDFVDQLSNPSSTFKRTLQIAKGLSETSAEPVVQPRKPRLVKNAELRLGETAVQELLERYRTGATVADLMATYNLGKGTVINMLRRHGVQLRNQGLSDKDLPTAIHLYRSGWSLSRIGDRYACDGETVRKRLHEQGVKIRKPWERK